MSFLTGFLVRRRVLYIPFAHHYSGVRVNHTGLAFAVFPLLPPSGSGLVAVKARFLGLLVNAALRSDSPPRRQIQLAHGLIHHAAALYADPVLDLYGVISEVSIPVSSRCRGMVTRCFNG